MKSLIKTTLILAVLSLYAFGDNLLIPLMKGDSGLKVDGIVGEEEYGVSSMIGGVLSQQKNFLIARDVEIYLVATDEALHLATRMSVENSDPDGGLVCLYAGKPKQYLSNDDCVEFFIGSATEAVMYQILVNSANASHSYYFDGKTMAQSKIMFESKCAVRNGYWEHELRIPWKSIPEIDKEKFRFNCARNFVAGGLGYASFTGQKDIRDNTKMLPVKSAEGFGGVKIHGIDTSLCRGILHLRCTGDKGISLSARAYNHDKSFLQNNPDQEQRLPNESGGKYISLHVRHPKFGEVFRRSYLPFKLGGHLSGGPVTATVMLDGMGTLFLRHYPEHSRCAVTLTSLGSAKSAKCEIASPDGVVCSGVFTLQNDNTWKAMIPLPQKRLFGKYTGALVLNHEDGEKRMEDVFSFEEKSFEWLGNKFGVSEKIMPPFTPITLDDANVLSTVLRRHALAANGLLAQVNAKGNDILEGPMSFHLIANGTSLKESNAKLSVVEKKDNRVVTESDADFGEWRYHATTEWDYDGFALVKVKFTPANKDVLDALTMTIPLKRSAATLYHALVDAARGNPGGLIPAGEGCVWDSCGLPRQRNKQGMIVVPGEFVPYIWVGGEERGLCLLFDSPKGFALEDGRPMLKLIRHGDVVELQCDIINLKGGNKGEPIEFSFGYQVTPVKPIMKEWRKWSFELGNKLPGMRAVQIVENKEDFGIFSSFGVVPDGNDYSYAKAVRETIKKRRVPYELMDKIHTDAKEKLQEKQKRITGKVDEKQIARTLNEMETRFMQHGMTEDVVIPYSCQSLIDMNDEAYQYHKAEWATRYQYREGIIDRIYMTKRAIEYELWAYRKMLQAGADGIYLDEVFVQPQTNPDLSTCRDYKGRVIPEMGLLRNREMNKRLAQMMFDMGLKDRPFCIHMTNTNIIPVFAFANIYLAWEYWMNENFITQFPLDYNRTVPSGLQCGVIPIALMNVRLAERSQITHEEFINRYNRLFRTGLGLMLQHGIYTFTRYWKDNTEQYKARYVLWAFGTHKDDCSFMPYWEAPLPFKASDGFVMGAYKRGHSALLILTNLGKAATARVEINAKELSITEGAVLIDAMTGEKFPLPFAEIPVPECEFRILFAGPSEFGTILQPPEPDAAFFRK